MHSQDVIPSVSKSAPDVPLVVPLQLSPVIAYYLRRLLRQNMDRLMDDQGVAIAATQEPTLDPNEILQRMDLGVDAQAAIVYHLHKRVRRHQSLAGQGVKYRQELKKTEQQIFELLGLKLPPSANNALILVIDDTPENLRLMSSALTQQGYEVRNAINGQLALSRAQMIKPDLILLDVTMPEIDGYEVCRRLKADPSTSDIPVIFVSALDAVFDKVQAFNVGGVDYITKPFQIEELLARIENQLNISNLRRRLEEQNSRLQQEIQERQQVEQRYQNLFEHAIDGMFQSTVEGRFTTVNPALAKMLGYRSPQDLIDGVDNVGRLYVRPGRRIEFMSYLQQHGMIDRFDSEVSRRDGQVIWITETARALKDDAGNLIGYEGSVKDITVVKRAIAKQARRRRQIVYLLLNLLPRSIAKRMVKTDKPIVDAFAEVSVLFVDLSPFIALSSKLSPADFVKQFNHLIATFERLAKKQGIEHTRLMGDRYLAVAGLPTVRANHATLLAEFALSIQRSLAFKSFQLRMGIHTGPILAGVIRERKLSYELWGETVTMAGMLVNESPSGKVQVSEATYTHLKDHYVLERRSFTGFVSNRRASYWLEGKR